MQKAFEALRGIDFRELKQQRNFGGHRAPSRRKRWPWAFASGPSTGNGDNPRSCGVFGVRRMAITGVVAMLSGQTKEALIRIVSGGQTGVDRGALDAALSARFPCGGWCPEGRQSEDGTIPDRYPLLVLTGSGYRQRTLQNVRDSDGTIILFVGALTGGTKLTRDFCLRETKPLLAVDAAQVSVSEAVDGVRSFIAKHDVQVLNVAGPRATGWGEGHQFAFDVIRGVLEHRDLGNWVAPPMRDLEQ